MPPVFLTLSRMNLWHFVWIAILLSFLLSLFLSRLIRGQIEWDYPLSATLIALVVASTLVYVIKVIFDREQTLIEALRESQDRFGSAFRDAAIGMALVGTDGRWLQVNPALCRLVGYTEQELMATTFQALTHPDDLDTDLEFVRQMLAGQIRTYQMEKRYVHKQGPMVWALLSVSLVRDPSGQPLYFISQIQDMTKRKQMEEQLTTSQLLFRAILENSPNMIFLKNTEGRYVLVNRQFEHSFHLDGAAILGKTDEEIFPAPQAAIFQENDRQVLQAARPMEFEELALHADGPRTSIVYKFPLRTADGQICCIGGITADITARKRAEEALRDSEQRLRHAFEDRERFSQDLHDHVIQSIYATGMALETCVHLICTDAQGAVLKLQKGIADLNAVMGQLRDYLEWGSMHTIKAEELHKALEALVRTIPRTDSFTIQLHIDRSTVKTLTDQTATHVLQIVREALTNTLRHANATSSTLSLSSTPEGVHLDIQDDGIGFDLDATSGYGWGLRNMAARAKKLDAKFQLISQRGGGTRISLDIPTVEHG